jgi:hypothetical protein
LPPEKSSFATVGGLESCFERVFGVENIVIRNFCCCKEMTTMTKYPGGWRWLSVRIRRESERGQGSGLGEALRRRFGRPKRIWTPAVDEFTLAATRAKADVHSKSILRVLRLDQF